MQIKVDEIDESLGDRILARITCYEVGCDNTSKASVTEYGVVLAKGWTLDTQDHNNYGFQCPRCKKLAKEKE